MVTTTEFRYSYFNFWSFISLTLVVTVHMLKQLRHPNIHTAFRAYFEQFGFISDAVVMFDRKTQRSRGFGFITFEGDTRLCMRAYAKPHANLDAYPHAKDEHSVGKVMQKRHELKGEPKSSPISCSIESARQL